MSTSGFGVIDDATWAKLEPLVRKARPPSKREFDNLRRTVEAIAWRCRNGAPWRAIPQELGPWERAAQTFIRWARHGAWDRLADIARAEGVPAMGVVGLDGSSVRAHKAAAGAQKKRAPRP